MNIHNIWKNKTYSKPPTSYIWYLCISACHHAFSNTSQLTTLSSPTFLGRPAICRRTTVPLQTPFEKKTTSDVLWAATVLRAIKKSVDVDSRWFLQSSAKVWCSHLDDFVRANVGKYSMHGASGNVLGFGLFKCLNPSIYRVLGPFECISLGFQHFMEQAIGIPQLHVSIPHISNKHVAETKVHRRTF